MSREPLDGGGSHPFSSESIAPHHSATALMERNPYAPPVSAVADPAEVRGARPKEVTQAVKLLWLSFFLGIGGTFLFQRFDATSAAQWIGVLLGGGLAFGFWAWVIAKIAKGRNWARILFLVLVILGLVATIFVMPTALALYKAQPLSGVLSLVNFVLEICTMYLLLTAPAREWFKQPAQ
jgi:hypothetical protein